MEKERIRPAAYCIKKIFFFRVERISGKSIT